MQYSRAELTRNVFHVFKSYKTSRLKYGYSSPQLVLLFLLHPPFGFFSLVGRQALVPLAHKGHQLPHRVIVAALHGLPLFLVVFFH